MALWEEFEAKETKEAILVNDLDKFEMMVQAFEYEKQANVNLESFYSCEKNL